MVIRAALLAVVALAACAKDLRELAPFPCPTDLRCPEGLTCYDGQCQEPVLDGACTLGDDTNDATDCGATEPPSECWAGFCTASCSGDAVCGSGRSCEGSKCHLECTGPADATCPPGQTCQSTGDGETFACLASGLFFGSQCFMFQSGGSCAASCGAQSFTVDCGGNSGFCAQNSTCIGGDPPDCQCNAGYMPVDCSGLPCTEETPCVYPNWSCQPAEAASCSSTQYQGFCTCASGRSGQLGCGQSCVDFCAADPTPIL